MRRRPLVELALAVLALLGSLTLTPEARAQAPGLGAAYGFSEGAGPTVADQSGNNNTGTLGSGVTWTAEGKYGSALVFNGTSGRVTMNDSPPLRPADGVQA